MIDTFFMIILGAVICLAYPFAMIIKCMFDEKEYEDRKEELEELEELRKELEDL